MKYEFKTPMYSNLLHETFFRTYVSTNVHVRTGQDVSTRVMLYAPNKKWQGHKRPRKTWQENTTLINQRLTNCANRENIDSLTTTVTYFYVKQPALSQRDNCRTRNDAKNICDTLKHNNQTQTSKKKRINRPTAFGRTGAKVPREIKYLHFTD